MPPQRPVPAYLCGVRGFEGSMDRDSLHFQAHRTVRGCAEGLGAGGLGCGGPGVGDRERGLRDEKATAVKEKPLWNTRREMGRGKLLVAIYFVNSCGVRPNSMRRDWLVLSAY